MTRGGKIALGIGIPVVLFSAYWFGIRNRRPYFSFESIDWTNKRGIVKFGNTENSFDLSGGKGFNAGNTYNSDLYSATINSEGEKVFFKVFKKDKLIQETVIDFTTNTKYDKPV